MKKFRLLPALSGMLILLTACSAQNGAEPAAGTASPDTAEQTAVPTAAASPTPSTAPDPTPLLNTEEQTALIESLSGVWKQDENEGDWMYAVTDLNHNGRCELITACLQGTGLYTTAKYWEVNASFDGIEPLEWEVEEGDSEPDIMADTADCFYDSTENTFWYVFTDLTRVSAAEYVEAKEAVAIRDGRVLCRVLGTLHVVYNTDGTVQSESCTGSDGAAISREEYDALESTVFAGAEKTSVSFEWLR